MSSYAKKTKHLSNIFIIAGLVSVSIAVIILLLTFFPVISEEIKYSVATQPTAIKKEIVPVDTQFGIVIPKIGANAKVIANIDPYNEKEYQWALTKGVAHAKGTQFFIFAHSSSNWYEANRYNSVFYLLHKLEKEDDIYLYFQGKKYRYKVVEKKFVAPAAVNYLQKGTDNSTLTLMTCWPPGTTLKRLIVVAKIS